MKKATKKEPAPIEVLAPIDKDRPTREDPIEYWVAWVAAPWQKSVESIIETGVRLIEFRNMNQGKWEWAINHYLGWSKRMGNMLIAIAECEIITSGKHVSHLPPSWGTLYQLTRLPDLKERIESEEVNSATQRADVAKMRRKEKPEKEKPDPLTKYENQTTKFSDTILARAREKGITELEYAEIVQARETVDGKFKELLVQLNEYRRRQEPKRRVSKKGKVNAHQETAS